MDIKNQIRDHYLNNWKYKDWSRFCKMVMDTDPRFHLLPIKHWYKASYDDAAFGTVFGPYILTMDGDYGPIDINFGKQTQGIEIVTGCAYIRTVICAYHSKPLVWPVIRLCEELNRQYSRMVERAVFVQKSNFGPDKKKKRSK